MSTKANPPFYAEHIGSLKRPQELLAKRAAFDKKECSEEELRSVEQKAIEQAVKLQQDVGLKAVTDGEYGRHMFFDGFHDHLEGFSFVSDVPDYYFKDYVPDVAAFKKAGFKEAATFMCSGKIRRTKPCAYGAEFQRLAKLVPADEAKYIKLTLAAPEWFHLRYGGYAYPKDVYQNDEEHFADIAKAYREELDYLYSLGCRNIQIDDPLLAYFVAESMLEGMKEEGVDSEALLTSYIKLYNDCLEGHHKDMTIGLHLCRGNYKDGRHFSEGGYDKIAARLFHEINADVYYLEYDTARAGGFEPLKYLPLDKRVVLGLISSKVAKLESVEDLKKRVEDAVDQLVNGEPKRSREVALQQLAISPQCGFASHSEGNAPNAEEMKAKLALVVKVAKEIWG